ncbi:MAG: Bug family tripartite tricarboxylate transporter substrate binding protein [Hyphomicrobiaceae bacterium]
MRFSTKLTAAAATMAVAVASMPVAADADDAKAWFKGKTINVIVPFGPGGGFDTYARMMAPHFSKYLDATVVVQNQPGGGGLLALNKVYTAPPDGTSMILAQGTGAALAQVLERGGVRYDLAKMGYLGTVSTSPWVVLTSPKSDIKTFADLVKAGRTKLNWAASGPSDGQANGAKLTCEVLKLDKCKIVVGFKGSSGVALAVTRGEMDAMYVSDASAEKYIKSGGLHPIFVFAREKSKFVPQAPTVFSLTKFSKDDEWLIDYNSKLENLGRILITGPNIPADRMKVLQDMVKSVLTDKAFVAESEKRGRDILYSDAATTMNNVMGVIKNVTPEQRARVVKLLKVEG